MSGAPYDSGNPQDVAKARKRQRIEQQKHDADFRWLMADERGRRLVWGWLNAANIFATSMRATPELTAFEEGQRNRGLALMSDITRLCSAMYQKMVAEAQTKTPAEKAEPNGEDDGRSDTD